MKCITTFMIMCSALFARDLPPVDETKPIYQLDWGIMPPGNMWIGGALSERGTKVYKLTPAERAAIEATANAAMYRKAAYASWVLVGLACIASYAMKWREGIGIAIICALFSFASSFMAQSVHYGLRIGVCIVVVVGVGLCYHPRVRDWSLSHSGLWKKLFNKDGGDNGGE